MRSSRVILSPDLGNSPLCRFIIIERIRQLQLISLISEMPKALFRIPYFLDLDPLDLWDPDVRYREGLSGSFARG